MLIAFDTIFDQCSIAILSQDGLLYDKTIAGGRGQTEIILPMLDEALTKTNLRMCDVKAWAFNRGPGAFSGIRINTALVQALSVANDAPCVGISSLLALASMVKVDDLPANQTLRITALIDARQNQVYAGDFTYRDGVLTTEREYLLDYESEVVADVVVGDGVGLIATTAQKVQANPTAKDIAKLAYPLFLQSQTVSAEQALPVYLRNNAWKTLAEQGKK